MNDIDVLTPRDWEVLIAAELKESFGFDLITAAFVEAVHPRGDTILIYRNMDFGSPTMGEIRLASYGSDVAAIPASQFPEPPTTLPDMGSQINWRFQLTGLYPPQEG